MQLNTDLSQKIQDSGLFYCLYNKTELRSSNFTLPSFSLPQADSQAISLHGRREKFPQRVCNNFYGTQKYDLIIEEAHDGLTDGHAERKDLYYPHRTL